ncbi:sigma-54 interaction domain-containing protein [Deferrisoma palaeochoriense]
MASALVAWIGRTDLRASQGDPAVGLGPIAQAVAGRAYERVLLLNNYPEEEAGGYVRWLQARTSALLTLRQVTLTRPTEFGKIYEAATQALSDFLEKISPPPTLAFHLSPGTPAMAAVWIILAKTRFPAELIESSPQEGVRTVSFPFDISADFLPDLLERSDRKLERLSEGLPPEAPEFSDIIHRSTVMKRLIAKARRVAPRSVSVVIEGESGTGKELLARAIHKASPRRDMPFVAINCGAIPSELVEAELFGHEKGAFTGASRARKGYFEEAQGGTLFLDEVGELPPAAQVKLLRALQEKEIVRVGSSKPIPVDVRVIAATNRSLMDEVAAGRFRSDLFYRLAVVILRLPPLRDRKGDVSLLVEHLLENINNENANDPAYRRKKLSAGAKKLLLAHTWPGNVRELLNTLHRAAIWATGSTIDEEDVREAILPAPGASEDAILGRPLGEGLNLPEILATVARHYLERAMAEAHGNKTQAARLLGLPSHQTLTNWLRRYGVLNEPGTKDAEPARA